jgi:hypothetical protein
MSKAAAVDLGPVVKTIDVRRSAADAFRIFTEETAAWWPLESHTRALSAKGQTTVSITVEPRVGGRVYETLQDGVELDWGVVHAFEPGRLFAMEWRLGRPQGGEVTVRFEPLTDKSCRVTLTHEHWDRMGDDAAKLRTSYSNGWGKVFEERFGGYANRM